eukprot:CAMPEP_0203977000 /NCGR_PEP_ID=MMETSP0359-20131031/101395_1 /ASSEMBLY_ACC=CAM_ASM_000338 /TAXON_ID=268821 /ORGANISM="Scrippsiella Hangoei, Strain SHTV-5" /LENGTH=756 /DNA_ID=CAMNT_0050915209 /DNA_START=1 /DNA_END=2268 /DNA_ORIENTATION=-
MGSSSGLRISPGRGVIPLGMKNKALPTLKELIEVASEFASAAPPSLTPRGGGEARPLLESSAARRDAEPEPFLWSQPAPPSSSRSTSPAKAGLLSLATELAFSSRRSSPPPPSLPPAPLWSSALDTVELPPAPSPFLLPQAPSSSSAPRSPLQVRSWAASVADLLAEPPSFPWGASVPSSSSRSLPAAPSPWPTPHAWVAADVAPTSEQPASRPLSPLRSDRSHLLTVASSRWEPSPQGAKPRSLASTAISAALSAWLDPPPLAAELPNAGRFGAAEAAGFGEAALRAPPSLARSQHSDGQAAFGDGRFAVEPSRHELFSHGSPRSHVSGPSRLRRLAVLASQFYALWLIFRPLHAWHHQAMSRSGKRHVERRQRATLTLRFWHLRAQVSRFRHELPLLRVLVRLVYGSLKVAWSGLCRPLQQQRRVVREALLLKVLHSRMRHSMALCHLKKSLLQRALGGFWLSLEEARRSGLRPPVGGQCRGGGGGASRAAEDEGDGAKQGVLLRVQQESWRRWCRAVEMDQPREAILDRRRQASLLFLLRSRALSSVALRFRVAALERRAFLAMRSCAEEGAEHGDPRSRRAAHCPRHAGRERGARTGSSDALQQGLRGTSVAEVLRKGWCRWRCAVSAGLWVVSPEERRPANIAAAFAQLADAVAEARRGGPLPDSPVSWAAASAGRREAEDTEEDEDDDGGEGDRLSEPSPAFSFPTSNGPSPSAPNRATAAAAVAAAGGRWLPTPPPFGAAAPSGALAPQ